MLFYYEEGEPMTKTNVNFLNHYQETEASILGGIILDSSIIDKLKHIIKPEYFSVKPWGKVYQIMLKIAKEGRIDPLILRQELENKKINYVGIFAISDWSSIAYTTYDTLQHAKKMVNQWKYRRFEELLYSSLDNLSKTNDISEISQTIIEEINSLSTEQYNEIPSANEIVALNRELNNSQPITTGYQAIDDYLGGGIDRGSVLIIAGSTSIGKSQFAVNISLRTCRSNIRCLYIIQEMNLQSMENQFISVISGIPQNTCRKLRVEKAMQSTIENFETKYINALEKFKELPLRIRAKGTISTSKFERIISKYHNDFDLVILDYMQQCRASYQNQESRERVDEISRMCKHLAGKYDLAIIALAQVSREGSKTSINSKNGRPQLHHLKESSSIEQDADSVIILHRKRNFRS